VTAAADAVLLLGTVATGCAHYLRGTKALFSSEKFTVALSFVCDNVS
jgi:hypothetical protein